MSTAVKPSPSGASAGKNAGNPFVECFEAEGIEYIFSMPG